MLVSCLCLWSWSHERTEALPYTTLAFVIVSNIGRITPVDLQEGDYHPMLNVSR